MKCEHEGCEATDGLERVQVELHGGDEVRMSPRLCAADRAAWLRALADEVEGVKECEECGGDRHVQVGEDDYEFATCGRCHGTGRVEP